jgi:hypothetical protein
MAVLNVKTLLAECITPGGKPRIDEVEDITKAAGLDRLYPECKDYILQQGRLGSMPSILHTPATRPDPLTTYVPGTK